MRQARPTLHTVAFRAGVSIATVSHVINGHGGYSDQVRARVEQAIRDVGYQPNAHARSLKLNRSRALGLVVPDNANPFFAEVARGIEAASRQRGYVLLLSNSDGDQSREQQSVEALASHQVDGLILISASPRPEYLERLVLAGLPLVVVDRALERPAIDTVVVDNRRAAREATEYLLALGHRSIACVAGPAELAPGVERAAGYRDALRAAGLPARAACVIESTFTVEGGLAAYQELARLPSRPTAVFACNDLLALGLMRAAQDAGRQIPRDLSVVGFDDILPATLVTPRLTTVAQPMRALGAAAATLLLDRLSEQVVGPPRHMVLDASLVVRESTAPSSPGGDR